MNKNTPPSVVSVSDAEPRAGRTRRPLFRIQRIHELVLSGKCPNCSTLAKEIEVTPKTIQRDINYMRDEMNLPLEYDNQRQGYIYTQSVSDFPLLKLSRNDLLSLFIARKALEPLRGTKLERVLAQSFEKITMACPEEVSIEWQDLDAAFSVKTAGVVEADMTVFGDLLDAVMEHREVTFDYHKLKGDKPERRRVRPYHVGQIEHGWYVIGFDVDRGAVRTFALQRISSLELHKTRFAKPDDFDIREHLRGSFGVWSYGKNEGARHEVRVRFSGYAARVIGERQWHASQEIIRDEVGDGLEFRVQVAGLEEITRWILSWGSKAKVLAPEILRARVADEVRLMAAG